MFRRKCMIYLYFNTHRDKFCYEVWIIQKHTYISLFLCARWCEWKKSGYQPLQACWHFRSGLYSVGWKREGQKGLGRPTGRPIAFLKRKINNNNSFFLKKQLVYQLVYHRSVTHFPTRACSVHAPLITMTDMCDITYCASASVWQMLHHYSSLGLAETSVSILIYKNVSLRWNLKTLLLFFTFMMLQEFCDGFHTQQ